MFILGLPISTGVWALALLTLLCDGTRAQQNKVVAVAPSDPRIVYVGNWTDQDNGGHRFALDHQGSSASLKFTGASPCWPDTLIALT
jgi:hypothetical protein